MTEHNAFMAQLNEQWNREDRLTNTVYVWPWENVTYLTIGDHTWTIHYGQAPKVKERTGQ